MNATRASLAEPGAALQAALESGFEAGLQDALKGAAAFGSSPRSSPQDPGTHPAKRAADPELRAFVEARLGVMTVEPISFAVASAPDRRIRRCAIYGWWTRHRKEPRMVRDSPRTHTLFRG